jgi:ankyrin repeat protein
MKKSIVYLGIALVSLGNVAMAANVGNPSHKTEATSVYGTVTPLCMAISKGETEIVRKFIEYGADVNERSNGMTPLMIAARYNNVEIIKMLLDNGADATLKNDRGFTALKLAESSKASDAIAYLSNIPQK